MRFFLVKSCAIFLGASLCSRGAFGADLSLNEAVARSLATSPKLRQAEMDYQSQVEKHRASWADVGPRVNFDYSMTQFNGAQLANFAGQSFVTRPKVVRDASLTATPTRMTTRSRFSIIVGGTGGDRDRLCLQRARRRGKLCEFRRVVGRWRG